MARNVAVRSGARKAGDFRVLRRGSGQSAETAEIVEGVESRAVTVAEIEPQRVVPHPFPTGHRHAGKTLRAIASVTVAEDVAFALVRGARRGRPQFLVVMKRLRAVIPTDGDLAADELDVDGRVHGAERGAQGSRRQTKTRSAAGKPVTLACGELARRPLTDRFCSAGKSPVCAAGVPESTREGPC